LITKVAKALRRAGEADEPICSQRIDASANSYQYKLVYNLTEVVWKRLVFLGIRFLVVELTLSRDCIREDVLVRETDMMAGMMFPAILLKQAL
jgi:hypothetical protein